MGEPVRIDCDECAMQHTEVCADCVVTFICSRQPDEAVVVDVAEVRALRLLAGPRGSPLVSGIGGASADPDRGRGAGVRR